ncbi:hypothetical protein GGI25_003508 [Coemansia spiralis]|uniref:Uncharacterized protein n=2 Tax=Coemansia TaxID=4863 RepID=A0A9W8KWE8_9FUNG|nr:hypothetical protein BX070DRAFT_226576 [Coemansia spiralis]KAJ1986146.1 hypothetical protein EDC05_006402 [Coemansia umbellata]KAJ2622114.1 hypothetical protein GGI26_003556 [Coemansia sp. RSA 1358]KAJ2676473.1 hypothetical protein GGI25_003508 [Coemansia spiralis]
MPLVVYAPTISAVNSYYLPVAGSFESSTPYMQYVPNKSAAYGMGGVFAALVLATAGTSALAKMHAFLAASLASACLMTSLFLRGSLEANGNVHIYEASLILNAAGAFLLMALTVALLGMWMRQLGNGSPFAVLLAACGALVLIGCLVLECTGVPLAFAHAAWYHRIGHVLHTTAVLATLSMSSVGLLVTLWTVATTTTATTVPEALGLAVPFAMLAVWSGYALAQAKQPLQAAANTSEVMWYLLDILPLALLLVVWVVLNAPRVFAFGDGQATAPAYYDKKKEGRPTSYYTYPYEDELPSYPMRVGGEAAEARIHKAILRYA